MPVNQVYKATGEKIIDISDSTVTAADLAEGVTAYDATGEKITGTGKIDDTKIYGIRINQAESDPVQSVIYLEDAVGMTPATITADSFDWGSWANAFFIPKPCMLTFSGTVDYYLDPNDYTKKADGTASDVANPNYNGNAMMEFPKMYYKWKREIVDSQHDYVYFYISNKLQEGFLPFTADYNGNITNNIYIGIYGGYRSWISDVRYRSISGITLSKDNYGYQRYKGELQSEINRYSTSAYNGERYRVRCGIMGLLYLIFKKLNVAEIIDTTNSGEYGTTTGWGDTMGLFAARHSRWYPEKIMSIKVFGIEDFLGTLRRYTFDSILNTDGYLYIENEQIYYYGKGGYYYYGYTQKMNICKYGFYSADTSGSSTTSWCTYNYYILPNSTIYPTEIQGGSGTIGIYYKNGINSTYSDSNGGAGRLCYYPITT